MASELELELTSIWSLAHAVASGCVSISIWEAGKLFNLGHGGTWVLFLAVSFSMVHAVHLHRRNVAKRLTPDVVTGNNQATEQPDGQQ